MEKQRIYSDIFQSKGGVKVYGTYGNTCKYCAHAETKLQSHSCVRLSGTSKVVTVVSIVGTELFPGTLKVA